jgi:nucleoside-diphosphate-sugar epimerase
VFTVLGGEGFVGSAFVRALQARKCAVTSVTRATYSQCAGQPCHTLINAAGNSRKYLPAENPAVDFDVSVTSILKCLSDFRPFRFVHISSIDVYNDVRQTDHNAESAPIHTATLSAYGFSKRLAELVVERHAPRWLIVRLGGMVGQGLKKNPIFDLLHGQPLRVHPDSAYQYLPTDVAAQITLDLVDRGVESDVFNLCGDGLVTPKQVAGWLNVGLAAGPGPVPERYEINIDKIQRDYSIPHSEATVKSFVEWYRRPS